VSTECDRMCINIAVCRTVEDIFDVVDMNVVMSRSVLLYRVNRCINTV